VTYSDFLVQIERPYWSPIHPSKYVAKETIKGVHYTFGWGLVYPDSIGIFNLMWLASGVGGPPDSYSRYMPSIGPVLDASFELVGGRYIKDLAATLPLDKFASRIGATTNPRIPVELYDALRLRV